MSKMSLMRYNLRLLAGITGIAILGIIVLQIFWLRNAYREQKDRFDADVENAVTEARVNHIVASSIKLDEDGATLRDTIQLSITNTSKDDDAAKLVNMTKTPDSLLYYTKKLIADGLTQAQQKKNNRATLTTINAFDVPKLNIRAFSATISEGLKRRNINTPFSLAIIENGKITQCTTDTNTFHQASQKSTAMDGAPFITGSIQLAFPKENFYLLRKIAWILLTSVVLILICGSSFGIMVTLFFRQKKISEIRNDFMSNMTHELKTPLSSVSVALQLMQDADISEIQRAEFYQVATNEISRLNMLIDKVMKMAAFEKNAIKLNKESIALQPLAEKAIQAFSPVLKKRGAYIHLHVAPENAGIIADRSHLTNILHNLIDNALKYNDKKDPVIEIDIQENTSDVSISVKDNGKGIPDAYLSRVFEKFFRVPSGNIHEAKGYGLGLSYVHAIVVLHRGSIQVESKTGLGSTFIIHLPKNID